MFIYKILFGGIKVFLYFVKKMIILYVNKMSYVEIVVYEGFI